MSKQQALELLADSTAYEYVGTADSELVFGVDQVYQGRDFLKFEDVLKKETDAGLYAVGRLSWSTTKESGQHKDYRQTTVYFHGNDLELPPFSIEPDSFSKGIMGGMLSLVGVKRLETGRTEFDKKFRATSMVPEATQPLLTTELIDFFLAHPDLSLATNGNRLGLCCNHQDLSTEQTRTLIEAADELVELLVKTERTTRSFRPSAEESMRDKLASGQVGLLGMAMGPRVSPQTLDDFLSRPAPRDIPPSVKALRVGWGSVLVVLVGIFFTVVGLALLADGLNSVRTENLVMGSLFPVIGLTSFSFGVWFRKRAVHLLRSGRVVHATVSDIKRTSVEVNNQRRYKVTFEFDFDTGAVKQPTNQYGPAVQKAEQLMESEQSARILVDPSNPKRIEWLEPYVL